MPNELTDRYIYIENTHNAPITCTVKDKDTGVVKLTKKFNHAMTEKWSGKTLATGYEKLTEAEYKMLCEGSRGFRHYKDDLKLLVVHEELPPEAKAPHEALADARRTAKAAEAKIKERDAVITELKAKLLDAETKYRTLESASSDEEKLAPLNEKIASLETANVNLGAKCAELQKANEEHRPPEDRTAELTARIADIVVAEQKFIDGIVGLVGKDKRIQSLVSAHTARMNELAVQQSAQKDFE